LDDLGPAEARALQAKAGERLLVTRLRDGSEVRLPENLIAERVGRCVAELGRGPVEMILLLCTGEFPELPAGRLILRPGLILRHAVRSVLPEGRIGLLVPAAEQVPQASQRWSRAGYDVVAESLSPYSASSAEFTNSARRLAAAEVDLIVLDCIGYTREHKSQFGRVTGKPVLLPRTLAARVARELAFP
ncbi:MAG: AroM family protein, partial [Acidobacteria bacterium]|nr:AroM family protein [Acidobacteriota bacterium]